MAWNEPGGGDKKDPWGKNDQGPPDLDELLKGLQNWLNGLFGGKPGSSSGNEGGGFALIALLVGVLLVVWGISGIYQVDARERAVILRLGKFHTVMDPGLHWSPRFIDTKEIISVTNEREYTSRGLMLTEDENIVEIPLTVQYNIADIKSFVLNVNDPVSSLQHATDSALRHVIGSSTLDKILSDGRQQIAIEIKERLQRYLDSYTTGIQIVKVNLQRAQPPQEVKAAFDDVIEAKEDRERFKNEAQAYANGIIPEARGQAQRVIEEANAYKAQVVAESVGEARRFEKLLTEYQKAPEVTRERLYIDTIEKVMASSTKVLVDVKQGNNMFYMPLDKIVSSASPSVNPAQLSSDDINRITEQVLNNVRRNTAAPVRSGSR